jgi:hypothetical protein
LSFSNELLKQADFLASKEPKRPKQASLRRATSNAYYALFHFLTWEASLHVAPDISTTSRMQMQRWFDHGSMYQTCAIFSATEFQGQFTKLIGSVPLPALQKVARNFRDLQQERHAADYDMASHWTRLRTKTNIQSARDAIQSWSSVRRSEQANFFALALLNLDRIKTIRA